MDSVEVGSPVKRCRGWVVAVTLFVASVTVHSAWAAQSTDDRISQLRTEIGLLERRIQEAEQGKRTVIQQLQDLDHQIELRRRLVRELEGQVRSCSRRIERLDARIGGCLLYTSPSPRDLSTSRMPSSA